MVPISIQAAKGEAHISNSANNTEEICGTAVLEIKYPNGIDFSASDIVSSTVLEKIWSENRLGEQGIKLDVFQSSFSAVPFTGELPFVWYSGPGTLQMCRARYRFAC